MCIRDRRNLADSREKAKAIIMSGNVFVEGQREDKAGTTFPEEVNIEVRGQDVYKRQPGTFRYFTGRYRSRKRRN